MSRPFSRLSQRILKELEQSGGNMLHEIYKSHTQAQSKKSVYDALYRLEHSGLIEQTKKGYEITTEGTRLIHKIKPQRDGIWKIIIYDIPESKRQVRVFLRERLHELQFKKWQNSIWVSPYALSPELEKELQLLAQKYFIRLIKTKDINYDSDLKKLFPQ